MVYRWPVPTERMTAVLGAMSEVGEDRASVIDRVCGAAELLVRVTGAGLSLIVDGELRATVGASGPGISSVQELELELGEGPGVDAWAALEPVLEPDLAAPSVVRWPAFASAAAGAGLLAVFAFPLRLGAIRIGVLELYRDHRGGLSVDEHGYALVLADVATWVVLGLQSDAPVSGMHELLASEPDHWAEVHQATGMAAVQLGVPLEEAFVRLRAHAFASGRPLRDVASDVVTRRLRLEPSS